MFRMGDEFMQTQSGNNNPYNQDNETSWLDWRRLEANQEVFRFFKKMIAFRKTHPEIGRSTFWREDIRWFGAETATVDLSDPSQALAFHLRAASNSGSDLYVMINGSADALHFAIHSRDINWQRVIDTSLPSPLDIQWGISNYEIEQHAYRVNPRSVVVLQQSIPSTGDTQR